MTEDELVQAHVFIKGRVQGVSFRYYTRQEATRLGLVGWVRNLRDGRVEAVFQGDKSAIEKIASWCEQGPRGAWVEKVERNWENLENEFNSFEIRYWGP